MLQTAPVSANQVSVHPPRSQTRMGAMALMMRRVPRRAAGGFFMSAILHDATPFDSRATAASRRYYFRERRMSLARRTPVKWARIWTRSEIPPAGTSKELLASTHPPARAMEGSFTAGSKQLERATHPRDWRRRLLRLV